MEALLAGRYELGEIPGRGGMVWVRRAADHAGSGIPYLVMGLSLGTPLSQVDRTAIE
jgi:hypothetical protein